MVDIKTLTLFTFLIAFIIHSEGRQINETICAPCKNTSACSSGKCVVLTGNNGYYFEICLEASACTGSNANTVLTLDVNPCNIDLYGAPCADGVCVSYSGGIRMCSDSGSCTPSNQSISCGSCKNTSGCKQCMAMSFLSGGGQSTEICVDSSLSNSSLTCNYQMNIVMQSCSGDSFGSVCSCCQTLTIVSGASFGTCISSDPYLKSLGASLKVYAKSEKSVLFSIMSLVLMAIFAFH